MLSHLEGLSVKLKNSINEITDAYSLVDIVIIVFEKLLKRDGTNCRSSGHWAINDSDCLMGKTSRKRPRNLCQWAISCGQCHHLLHHIVSELKEHSVAYHRLPVVTWFCTIDLSFVNTMQVISQRLWNLSESTFFLLKQLTRSSFVWKWYIRRKKQMVTQNVVLLHSRSLTLLSSPTYM